MFSFDAFLDSVPPKHWEFQPNIGLISHSHPSLQHTTEILRVTWRNSEHQLHTLEIKPCMNDDNDIAPSLCGALFLQDISSLMSMNALSLPPSAHPTHSAHSALSALSQSVKLNISITLSHLGPSFES